MASEGKFDEVGDSVRIRVALVRGGSGFVRAAEVGLSPEIGGGRLTTREGKSERALVRIVDLDPDGASLNLLQITRKSPEKASSESPAEPKNVSIADAGF